MADIGSDFKARLKSIPAITEIVGAIANARIYPDTPKHKMTLPAIVYTETGGDSIEHLGGALGMGETVMQVDAYAATRAAANSLSTTIRVNVQGPQNITWGDSYVSSVTVLRHRFTEEWWAADKQSIKGWITRIALRIFHEEDQ